MKLINFQKPIVYVALAFLLFFIHEQFASKFFLKNVFSSTIALRYCSDLLFYILAIVILAKFRLNTGVDYLIFVVVNVGIGLLYLSFFIGAEVAVDLYTKNRIKFEINNEFLYYGYIRGGYVLSNAMVVDFFRRGKRGEFEAAEAREKQKELEYAMHFTQVSPHFINNALLLIKHQAEPVLPSLSKAIDELFSIYRYATVDLSTIKNVPLVEETAQIISYLEYQEMLNNAGYKKQLIIDTTEEGLKALIPPMLFFNFVENIFMHGNFRDPEHPFVITISYQNNHLHFYCRNTLKEGGSYRKSGLGLKHTMIKLEHNFPGKYSLKHGIIGNFYEVDLKMYYGAVEL